MWLLHVITDALNKFHGITC